MWGEPLQKQSVNEQKCTQEESCLVRHVYVTYERKCFNSAPLLFSRDACVRWPQDQRPRAKKNAAHTNDLFYLSITQRVAQVSATFDRETLDGDVTTRRAPSHNKSFIPHDTMTRVPSPPPPPHSRSCVGVLTSASLGYSSALLDGPRGIDVVGPDYYQL